MQCLDNWQQKGIIHLILTSEECSDSTQLIIDRCLHPLKTKMRSIQLPSKITVAVGIILSRSSHLIS